MPKNKLLIKRKTPLFLRMGYGRIKRACNPDPVWKDKEFLEFYQWLLETQWWSREQYEEYQNEQLRAIIKHAYQNIPYYHRQFDKLHLKPQDINTKEDLQKLPILTKSDVRNNFEALIDPYCDRASLSLESTGGSTGQPLAIYHNKTSELYEFAFSARQWNWAGYHPGDRILRVRGYGKGITGPDAISSGAWWDYETNTNTLVLSPYNFREENLSNYIDKINWFKPEYINGYASALEILARFLLSSNRKVYPPKAIFCESETIFPSQRSLIETQFGSKIFAAYGLTELVADATECELHNGYHVSMEYGIFELLNANHQVVSSPNTPGLVVGTGFGINCMPLIRYSPDDLAEYAVDECACGRHSTLINQFYGRVRDFVVSKNGGLVPLMATYSYHGTIALKIREIHFIQEKEGLLNIEVVKNPSYTEEEIRKEYTKNLYDFLDPKEFTLEFKFVDQIARTERGKILLLEQKLPIKFDDMKRSIKTNV
jgi:phenylacetate-CoA ligase